MNEWFSGVYIPSRHGRLPTNVTQDVSARLVTLRCQLLTGLEDKTEEVRRLGMGRLLGDLSRKMQNKATQKDKDPLKILIHSTHDTGLAALSSTLDVFDDKCVISDIFGTVVHRIHLQRWPAFTASIIFELFKKSQTAAQPTMLQTILSPFRVRPVDEYCESNHMLPHVLSALTTYPQLFECAIRTRTYTYLCARTRESTWRVHQSSAHSKPSWIASRSLHL